ncbi:MAG TPA: SIMPL domain-containing protein [Patescibacteria group bacterium]|nr:SIMPL domain-containing protein [Patescibacteria group bacterium]
MEQNNSCCAHFDKKHLLIVLGMVLLAAIIIVSILRDWITNDYQNQVSVTGQGKVFYQPDEANVNLGIQVDKAVTAQDALDQLNVKMTAVVSAVKGAGIPEEDIKTQNYNLYPNHDYSQGRDFVSGYNASQNLVVKVRNVDKNKDLTSRVVSAANGAGVNNIGNISFTVSDMNAIRQKARVAAINDAKSKADELFKAAGVKPKKIVSWYENGQGEGGGPQPMAESVMSKDGRGGSNASPEIPAGNQEIIVEMNVNYEVK